jgi:hypothetical protein
MFIILRFISKLIAFALITLASFVIFSISIMAYIGEIFVRQTLRTCEVLFRKEKTDFSFLACISMLIRVVEQAWHASGRLPYASSWGFADGPFANIISQVVIHVSFSWRHLTDVIACYKDACFIYKHLQQFWPKYDAMNKDLRWYRQNRTHQDEYLNDLQFSFLECVAEFQKTFILNPFSTLLDTTLRRYLEAWVSLVDAWAKLDAAWEETDAYLAGQQEQPNLLFLIFHGIASSATDDSVVNDDENSALSLVTDGSSDDNDDNDDDSFNWPYGELLPPLVTDDDIPIIQQDRERRVHPLVTNTDVRARGGGPNKVYHRCTLLGLQQRKQI